MRLSGGGLNGEEKQVDELLRWVGVAEICMGMMDKVYGS